MVWVPAERLDGENVLSARGLLSMYHVTASLLLRRASKMSGDVLE
jgi:hypothetical protein